jgi:hypothetical protein
MAPYSIQEIRNTIYIYIDMLRRISTFLCKNCQMPLARTFRGGSIKKSKELKTRMKMVKKRSDLQGSEYRLTSVIPSS